MMLVGFCLPVRLEGSEFQKEKEIHAYTKTYPCSFLRSFISKWYTPK